ncbi:MAG: glycosyl hydrolase family 28-related protein, partial [Terracidiphilus sp.]
MDRRNFLTTAVRGAMAAPVAAGLSSFGWAQAAKPAASHAATKPAAHPGPTVSLNVKDYGAAGDGKSNDTLALQLAIERCAVLGGGEVVFPAGDYATGALALRSNVTLRIADGASLLGSGDMADYPIAEVRWEGRWIKGYGAFISATDAENIGIVGPGKIIASDAIRGRVNRATGMRLPALLEFT